MRTVGLLLLLVATISATSPATRALVTPGAGFVTINNEDDLTGSALRVDIRCNYNQVFLTLVRTGTLGGQGQIQIGNNPSPGGGVSCLSPVADIPVAPAADAAPLASTISATADTCGGTNPQTGVITEYRWNVRVTEFYSVGGNPGLSRPVESTFDVACISDAENPPLVGDLPLVSALAGDLAQSEQSIEFDLIAAQNTNPRIWVLTLNPEDATLLRGLSYEIVDLAASVPGVPTADVADPPRLSALLITNGCIRDTAGVRAVKVAGEGGALTEVTTITVARFQFTANPTAQVSFTATVKLCPPSAIGGVCPAVAGCTVPGARIAVANSNDKAKKAENTVTVRAVGSARPRRSLNRSSFGLLSARLV